MTSLNAKFKSTISTLPFMKAKSNGLKSEDIQRDRKGKGMIEKIKIETNQSQMIRKKTQSLLKPLKKYNQTKNSKISNKNQSKDRRKKKLETFTKNSNKNKKMIKNRLLSKLKTNLWAVKTILKAKI